MPGVNIHEGALLGSYTVGPDDWQFPPNSISIGQQQGKPVLLRASVPTDSSSTKLSRLPTSERAVALTAKRYMESTSRWIIFNLACACFVTVFSVAPQAIEIFVVIVFEELCRNSESGSAKEPEDYIYPTLIAWGLFVAADLFMMLLMIALKWLIVGRYTEGSYPFFGAYHHKWMLMTALSFANDNLLDLLQGTAFYAWVFRASGATVGRNACIFGFGLEFDLLEIGDNVCIGDECDLTCHTVENMAIKLAKVTIGNNTTMRASSLVMPGGETQENTALLEKTVVLKGEVVLSGTTYGGLPADRLSDAKPLVLEYCTGMLSGHSVGAHGSSEVLLDATANCCLA